MVVIISILSNDLLKNHDMFIIEGRVETELLVVGTREGNVKKESSFSSY